MSACALKWLATSLCIVYVQFGIAQVKSKIFFTEVPNAALYGKAKPSKSFQVPIPIEFQKKFSAVKNTDSSMVLKEGEFAVAIPQNIDLISKAEFGSDGTNNFYSFGIRAKGALNLSVNFSRFMLPENAVLTIYTKKDLTDSITFEQNNSEFSWATKVYQGDELFFFLSSPSKSRLPELVIGTVNAGFLPFGDYGNVGASAACNINANCPAGNGWNPEKNSVALIVSAGTTRCTGALIMNACGQNIPYILTAEHAINTNVGNWVFQFQTWSTSCNSNVGWIETVQYNGASIKAVYAPSDAALLQLNTVPTASSGLYYSGWNRQTTGITSTTVLHHPVGDLMKISQDNGVPIAINSASKDVWQMNLDLGILQGGSSGAPYYDQNHRIIGTHYRRPDSGILPECDIREAHGGRLNVSWTGGGTNGTRLSNWLDPSNSGVTTTNTTSISALSSPMSMSGDNFVCSAAKIFSIANLPSAATVTWSVSPSALVTMSCTSCAATTLTAAGHGQITLTANITSCGVSQQLTKSLRVGVPAQTDLKIYSDGPTVCRNVPVDFGAFYKTLTSCTINQTGATSIEWNFSPSPASIINNSGMGYCFGVNNSGIEAIFTTVGTYNVKFRTLNSCGYSAYSNVYQFQVVSCGSGFTLTPNPAGDIVEIGLEGSRSTFNKDEKIKEVTISDQSGQPLKHYRNNVGTTKIAFDISNLRTGIYTVRISDGLTTTTLKLAKK